MQNKCINCSPRVCFYNNHPEAIQHTTVSNQYCRQCKAHPSEQDNITSPEWEKKQNKNPISNFQSLTLVRTLPGLRMLVSNRAPTNTLHRNYLLFAIINSDTNVTDI